MRALSAAELLAAWEQGLVQSPLQRALTLLAAACPEILPDALARLNIGERDARLLTLREWTFGSQLTSLVNCPHCGERLELNFAVAEIRAPPAVQPVEELTLTVDGYEVGLRLPNSLDLAAITGQESPVAAREQLLRRCLLRANRGDEPQTVESLPETVVNAMVAHLAQADPQADIHLALECPRCAHRWQALFDIVAYFWIEINAWAKRILDEVHSLASAYGWREQDILALSPARRQSYLDRVNG